MSKNFVKKRHYSTKHCKCWVLFTLGSLRIIFWGCRAKISAACLGARVPPVEVVPVIGLNSSSSVPALFPPHLPAIQQTKWRALNRRTIAPWAPRTLNNVTPSVQHRDLGFLKEKGEPWHMQLLASLYCLFHFNPITF